MLRELRDGMVKWKFRISYFSGFLTTFAAIIIIANTLQDKSYLIGLNIKYWIILLIVLVGVIIGAYIFDKFGFITSEIGYANTKNQVLSEIYRRRR